MGCGNSKSSSKYNNKVHGHSTSTTKYGYSSSTTQAYDPSLFRGDEYYVHKPRVMYYSSEEQNDDTFNDYIQRAGQKIRTPSSNIDNPESISNISSSSPTAIEHDDDVANNTNNYYCFDKEKVNQNDQQFSDFIQIAKKKLRTTSRLGRNNGSFKRG